MTYWVHRPVDGRPWHQAKAFDPPPPKPVAGKGYATYLIEIDGFVFRFSSLVELDVCIDILGQKNLPSTEQETRGRSGPGKHWLNKLPGDVLSWRYREKAVVYMRQCREEFR